MSVASVVSSIIHGPWEDKGTIKAKKTQEYLDWLRAAGAGGKFTYHIGLSPQESFIASGIASLIYRDYQDGYVFPFSVRKGPHNFEFIVVRSTKKF